MNRRALSLAELMLALLLLAVAYVPLAQLFHFTAQQTLQSRNQLLAYHLSANFFELWRMRRDTLLAGASGAKGEVADVLASGTARALLTGEAPEIEDPLKMGQTKMRVEFEAHPDGAQGLTRLEITISWQEDGRPRSATFGRLVAD